MRKLLWLLPNKTKINTGVYKYNIELIDLLKKKKFIKVHHTGKIDSYIFTFISKFLFLPFFLLFNSKKFDCVVYPEEGFGFLSIFSHSKENTIIVHDFRKEFNKRNKIKILENIKQKYINFNFFFINKFKKIIVPSLHTKKLLSDHIKNIRKKIIIIPNIINIKKNSESNNFKENILKKKSKNKQILSVSSNESRKNISLILKIANKLNTINFIIIGNIKIKKKLPNLFIYKKLNQNELNAFYNNSNMYLDVSLFEGFGRTSIEAQSFGLPVVCFDTPTNKEILLNSGNFIKKKFSVNEIISFIKSIKKNKKQMIKSKKNAFRFSKINIKNKFKKEIYDF
tara:strand:+ start:98 stop:1117 length:1020 start_codon:yes stop_codon:yes gene_type:complete